MNTPQLRMDKSKYFSTVHGERTPDDRHAGVHFYQDGIPFDHDGLAMPEVIDGKDAKAQATYQRKLRRLATTAGQSAEEDVAEKPADDDDRDEHDLDDRDVDDINLEAWARGDAQYPWFAVSAAIRKRYAKQVTSAADAIVFLVNEKVLPPGMVAKRFQDALK